MEEQDDKKPKLDQNTSADLRGKQSVKQAKDNSQSGEAPKEVEANVTVCEYVKDEAGNRYMGVESDPTPIKIRFEEEEDSGNNTPYVETNISEILPLAWDGFSGFEYYYYPSDAEYKPLAQNAQPSGNYYSINGDQIC